MSFSAITREQGGGPVAGRSWRVVFFLAVFLGTLWTVESVGEVQADTPKTPAIRLLVVPTHIQARDAIIRATSGVPFEQIVREQSTGPERARGGYLGRVDPATLSPSVRAALAKTRVGRLSPVFETEGGFGVLQVLTNREEREVEARLLRKPEALELLGKGIELGKQGDVDGAVKLLAQAVELDPGLADAQYNLGIGLWRLKQWEAAIRAMQEAAWLQPDDYDAHMRLGAWLAASGRRGEAVAEYERAVGLNIESPDAWMKLAQVYDAAGRGRAAMEAYRRVLGLLGRDDPLVLEALLRAALQAEDGPTAVDAARKLLARRSDHEGFLLLGDALMLSKQPEAAIQEYRKAVALAPGEARGHLEAGRRLCANESAGAGDRATDRGGPDRTEPAGTLSVALPPLRAVGPSGSGHRGAAGRYRRLCLRRPRCPGRVGGSARHPLRTGRHEPRGGGRALHRPDATRPVRISNVSSRHPLRVRIQHLLTVPQDALCNGIGGA